MGSNTKIEWCDHTFNPWYGCTKISPACDHCYAEAWADRLRTVKWGAGNPRKRTSEANWRLPLKWDREAEKAGTRPRVFCASLSDVFDNEVPDAWRMDLFALIGRTPNLTWLLLTKRIGNVREYCRQDGQAFDLIGSDRVWLGATICNQEEADRDIPKLLDVPAVVRFVSIEPMLGPIDIAPFLWGKNERVEPACQNCPRDADCECGYYTRKELGLRALDWIITGAESGPNARPSHPDWLISLRDQCQAGGVAFFFKQWGEWLPCAIENPGDGSVYCTADDGSEREILGNPAIFTHFDGTTMARVGKKFAGRTLDGMVHNEFPR